MMNGSDQNLGPHKHLIKLNIGLPKKSLFCIMADKWFRLFFYDFLMIHDESSCQNLSPTCFWPSKVEERFGLYKWAPQNSTNGYLLVWMFCYIYLKINDESTIYFSPPNQIGWMVWILIVKPIRNGKKIIIMFRSFRNDCHKHCSTECSLMPKIGNPNG